MFSKTTIDDIIGSEPIPPISELEALRKKPEPAIAAWRSLVDEEAALKREIDSAPERLARLGQNGASDAELEAFQRSVFETRARLERVSVRVPAALQKAREAVRAASEEAVRIRASYSAAVGAYQSNCISVQNATQRRLDDIVFASELPGIDESFGLPREAPPVVARPESPRR